MPQSLASVVVHLIFSTKDRHPYFTKEIREDPFPYFGGILRSINCPLLQAGGVEDHVHLLLVLARTMALSKVVEEVKTGSSKWMKTKGDAFCGFAWQAGYAAFSVDSSVPDGVRKYVLDQEQHHQKVSFQEELRALFKEAGIEFDERYVWD